MNGRLLIAIILFFILGSVAISGMDFLSYTFKSVFYMIAFFSLIVIGFISLIRYLKQ